MPIFMLDFFGILLNVMGAVDLADLPFLFGPHLREELGMFERAELTVRFASVEGAGSEVRVHDDDGRLLRRHAFHGLGGIPPLLPPFAVLGDRFAVLQAAVLAKNDAVVALVGGVESPRSALALALGVRGWRMVSAQRLVVDRATGQTLPLQVPLELRGAALESAHAWGLPEKDLRTASSPLTGSYLQVRPESLMETVPVGARLGPATVVRLCTAGGPRAGLEDGGRAPAVWPVDATALLDRNPRARLLLPPAGGVEEAADLLDARLCPPLPKETAPCPADLRTTRERPAGSTMSASIRRAPRTSTGHSSTGSSAAKAAAATT
ncbi:hypothetical protein GCM10010329_39470 [Streptomyces spiroverticillatus]|uniref:Uncharacterized protein n=1 Tax=Streptomyces finlayi TaxID=67296 RepID=A0A918WZR5_9ACTN|nr:hypothetical protein [Streptomyces finlayi]GHA12804.1 hypothetical protein GCM10010329_39470 [Streptomyces spiroverticillatus]GHC98342.1 hypothetical protein GCM10010334_40770 [Streptomyces finlayi]